MKVGDIVRGTEHHINPDRMNDLGVIVEESNEGFFITWFGGIFSNQYADRNEVKLVWSSEYNLYT